MKLKPLHVVLALILSPTAHAASHTWSGAVNGLFSNPGNWSSGGVPTLAETNVLVFPPGATRFTITNDIGALKVTSINLSGSGYVLRGASTLTFLGNVIDIQAGGATNTIESPIHFNSTGAASVGTGDALVLAGAISGSNGFVKFGYGDLYFRGAASNPLSGKLHAAYGTLHFQKSGGATPYNGNQIEIGITDTANPTYLELHASDCIPDGATLTFAPSGILTMNGFSDAVGAVTMHGGLINGTGGSLLRMDGTLTLTPRVAGTNMLGQLIFESPTLWGAIQFGGTSATIQVTTNIAKIEAIISEYSTPSPINKTGPGQLTLAAANTFAGQLNVLEGAVFAEEVGALGTTAGNTVVASGASLELPSGVTISEPLVLSGAGVNGGGALQLDAGGNTTASGLITVSNLARVFVPAAQQLQFSGVVAGPGGIEKTGPGDLLIAGVSANTFSGASFVNGGKMLLGKTSNTRAISSVTVTNGAQLHFNNHEQMDNAGVLSIYQGAVVNVTNRTETLGGLNLSPRFTLDLGTGLLTLNGNVYVGSPYYTKASFYSAATIRGQVSLGGATRLIDTPGFALALDGNVIDGSGVGGFIVGPPGGFYYSGLQLLRSNSFSGLVLLHGSLSVSNDFALGAPGGGVIANTSDSELRILGANTAISGETLTLSNYLSMVASGSNTWNGPIQMPAGNLTAKVDLDRVLTLGGTISGLGGMALGSEATPGGTLRLMTANTYSGTTDITEGTLVIRHPQGLGSPAGATALYFGPATLQLELPDGATVAGEPLTVSDAFGLATLTVVGSGSNSWTGAVANNTTSRFRVNQPDGGTFTFDNIITGSGGIEKNGSGSLYFSGGGANTFAGDTVVNDGTLFLNKPNGVQAVGNLTINAPGDVKWLGSEQVADAATLRIQSIWPSTPTNVFLFNQHETLTGLRMWQGRVSAGSGSLGLLGNIVLPNDQFYQNGNVIWAKLRLAAGTHVITNSGGSNIEQVHLYLNGPVEEFDGVAGIWTKDCAVHLAGSNSFTGPIVVDGASINVYHPHALGDPAQGVVLTNSAGLLLDMPNGSVIAGESLLVSPPAVGSTRYSRLTVWEFTTNTWNGPITLLGENRIMGIGTASKLILSGPVFGPAAITVDEGAGEVELAGPDNNTTTGLNVYRGTVRLNKTPGAHAFTGLALLDGDEFDSVYPRVILGASGQFPPTTEFAFGPSTAEALFDLNGHSATIAGLGGTGGWGTVNIRSGTLTIAPSGASYGFSGVVLANAGGPRLIKQGTGSQALFASLSFNAIAGDLLVQNGNLTLGDGIYGPVNIAAGASVEMYAFSASFDSLSGAGILETTYAGTTRVGENNASTEFSGTIKGNTPNSITKTGTGTLNLTGTNTHTGTLRVENGTLLANGYVAGTVRVQPVGPGPTPALGGTGTLHNVVVTGVGARIAPGGATSIPSYGRLTVTNIAIDSGALYLCEIGGTNAGVNLDQIEAMDTFTLTGGAASFTAFGAGVTSNRYAVVKSFAAVSGTFSGDPEGDTIIPAAGRSMTITYLTSAGKEITLIEQPGANLADINITGIVQEPGGHVTLTGSGNSGSTYFIEANTNLATTNWITLGSVVGDGNGGISFTDTNAPSYPQRFYRFRLQ